MIIVMFDYRHKCLALRHKYSKSQTLLEISLCLYAFENNCQGAVKGKSGFFCLKQLLNKGPVHYVPEA